jgi:hypothetical protein
MKNTSKHLLLAALLATFGLSSMAQTPPAGGPGMAGHVHAGAPVAGQQGDPAKMQALRAERHAKHMADMKIKLQLTPAQEGAWTTFAAGMQPPAHAPMDRAQMHADMEKLTTPERIDKMLALKTQRDAEMTQRAATVKTFYATLTPSQKKVFDLESLQHHQMGHHGRHGGMGMGHGGMEHGMMGGHGMGGMGMSGPARN